MKPADQSLAGLLRAAAQCRRAVEPEPPFGFSTRVIAGWRAAAGRGRIEEKMQAVWFRRAFLCAVMVMAISVGWSYKTDTAAPNDELTLAGYDANADLP